jgi:hypothetical protein
VAWAEFALQLVHATRSYGAVLEAVCRAWNKLVDDKGRLTTLTAYPYLIASEIP